VVISLVAILALQTGALARSAAALEKTNTIISSLHVLVALYTLVLAAISLPQNSVMPNTYSITHVSIITFLALLLLGTTAILPGTYHVAETFDTALKVIWYTVLGLYGLAFLIISTTPMGPLLHYPVSQIYDEKTVSQITNTNRNNVVGSVGASVWGTLLFSYTTQVVMLGNTSDSLEIGDLPIVPGDMRASTIYASMKIATRKFKLRFRNWVPKSGTGWDLGYRLIRLNKTVMITQLLMAVASACIFYVPAYFLRLLLQSRQEPIQDISTRQRGWFYTAGLFVATVFMYLLTGQLWSLSTTTFQVRLKIQLNSILFAKTLVRKDVASSAASVKKDDDKADDENKSGDKKEENEFSSKAQVMTLMTTDVDRVSEFAWHMFSLIDAPIEIVIGSIFLYKVRTFDLCQMYFTNITTSFWVSHHSSVC
jgi:hypothetical protein